MKQTNNTLSGETIAIIIVILIILIALFFFVSNIFNTNSVISNNNQENKITINDTKNTTTQTEQIDTTDNDKTIKTEQVEEKIAEYTTTIYDTDANRIDNIKLTVSKLNGKIVKKDEEFSFNNTIGPMNEDQGFKKALGFDSYGNKIQISGGGICQISSTLYNSVLIANLNVTERHAHSRRVYYVPQDKDATILYGVLDLKFINNRQNDIKIEATTDGANVSVILKEIKTIIKTDTL